MLQKSNDKTMLRKHSGKEKPRKATKHSKKVTDETMNDFETIYNIKATFSGPR